MIEKEEIYRIIPETVMKNWTHVPELFTKPHSMEEYIDAIEYFDLFIGQWEQDFRSGVEDRSLSHLTYVKAGNHKRKFEKVVDDIQKKAAELEITAPEQSANEDSVIDSINRFTELVTERNLHYIENENLYFLQSHDGAGRWYGIKKEVLQNGYGINVDKTTSADLSDILDAADRKKENVVCTFKKHNRYDLNILEKGNWLDPTSFDYHPILDVLFASITDRNENNAAMLEKWILYKRFKPEDHRLMAIVIYGEGKVGKTEFIDTIISTLYGNVGVKSLSSEQVFGQFNEEMLNTVIVLIDEFAKTKAFSNNLKLLIGNSTMSFNKKNGLKGLFANTPAYMIAANGDEAENLLTGTGIDIRYGMIPVKRNIIIHTMIHLGMDTSLVDGLPPAVCKNVDENYVTAEKWYNNNLKYLTDSEHVAGWFGGICKRNLDAWNDDADFIMDKPTPNMDEVYSDAVATNQQSFKLFADYLFTHPLFTSITRIDCYAVFKLFLETHVTKWEQNNVESEAKFWKHLSEYVGGMKGVYITKDHKHRINMTNLSTNKRFNFSGVYRKHGSDWNKYNPHDFLTCTDYGSKYSLDGFYEYVEIIKPGDE